MSAVPIESLDLAAYLRLKNCKPVEAQLIDGRGVWYFAEDDALRIALDEWEDREGDAAVVRRHLSVRRTILRQASDPRGGVL